MKRRDVFRDGIRQQNSPAASGEEQFHNSVGQWDKIQPNPNKKYVCKAVRSRERPRKCQKTLQFSENVVDVCGGRRRVEGAELPGFRGIGMVLPELAKCLPGSLPFFLLFFSTKVEVS